MAEGSEIRSRANHPEHAPPTSVCRLGDHPAEPQSVELRRERAAQSLNISVDSAGRRPPESVFLVCSLLVAVVPEGGVRVTRSGFEPTARSWSCAFEPRGRPPLRPHAGCRGHRGRWSSDSQRAPEDPSHPTRHQHHALRIPRQLHRPTHLIYLINRYYDPEFFPSYGELATHHQTVELPARAGYSPDSSTVEAGAVSVGRRALAPLRNRQPSPWPSSEHVAWLWARPFRGKPGNWELFTEL